MLVVVAEETEGEEEEEEEGVRGWLSAKPKSAVGAYCTQLCRMRAGSREGASSLRYRSRLSVYVKRTVNPVYESGMKQRKKRDG